MRHTERIRVFKSIQGGSENRLKTTKRIKYGKQINSISYTNLHVKDGLGIEFTDLSRADAKGCVLTSFYAW